MPRQIAHVLKSPEMVKGRHNSKPRGKMAADKSSSAFDERMSNVLSAIDTAMVHSGEGARDEDAAHSNNDDDSHNSRRDEGRRSADDRPWRSRSPIGSRRHREHDVERVNRDHRAERVNTGNGDAERVNKRDYRAERDERANRRRGPGVESGGRRGGRRRGKEEHVPSHVADPAKWKEYDLSTDGSEDLVREGLVEDEVNRHVAFEFLKEARERREGERRVEMEEEEEVVGGVGAGKVVFTKPNNRSSTSRRGESGAGARRKEAVAIGKGGGGGAEGGVRKRRAEQGVRSVGGKRTSMGVSLSHLAEEEEEEVED